jgi:trafficking protein particle complex subunit 6
MATMQSPPQPVKSSAFGSSNTTNRAPQAPHAATSPRAVSEQLMEFLLAELSLYAARTCQRTDADPEDEETMTVAAEMAAAKMERLGAAVGYRFTERLAEHKTWNAVSNSGDVAAAVAAQQLEAVKFLCKELWMEMFNKQMDKLQTNHRGVFVLKDLELKWLTRFPVGSEQSRVSAIRFLAFPCGVLRGALANLGIPAVVSCDFLADGQNMAACSFNIKVK